MTIDWVAFLAVFAVALASACVVVLCFATAIRLLASPHRGAAEIGTARDDEMDEAPHGARPRLATVGAIALFVVSGVVALLGIWLISPLSH